MEIPPNILRTLACGVASWLLLALPAAGQTTRPADPDPSVPEARQQLEEVAAGIRGAWAMRDDVVEAQEELERAQRDFHAEYRRVVMRLRQEDPEYPRLQEQIVKERRKLHGLRRQRLEPPPRSAEEAQRRSDGTIVARVGGTGRTTGHIMGENTNSRGTGLSRRERNELRAIVREREPAASTRSRTSRGEQEAAARLLAIQAEIDELEAAAILEDALASEMKAALDNAAERMEALEQDLADELQNDPDFQAARQALADAYERATPR